MKLYKSSNFTNRGKLLLWLGVSLAISFLFFSRHWASLAAMLSPNWILGQHHAAPWGVLTLCSIWLYLKRKEIGRGMNLRAKFNFAFCSLNFMLGVGLVVGAILIPFSLDYLVFKLLLVWLGTFVIFFGRAARIPSILLGIYALAISFPLMVARFAEQAYSRTAIVPLMGLLTTLGYPVDSQGQWVHLVTASGEPITVAVTSACAGPVTMGVFMAIFALMMLDIPLPPRKAVGLFLFGAAGTWAQNLLRLVILMLLGYYRGEDAMWTAHFWSIYILFPLWYLLFVYIYFRQTGGEEQRTKIRIQKPVVSRLLNSDY